MCFLQLFVSEPHVLTLRFAGIGKTSLIRSIVQSCEDIVHVDPLSPTQSLSQPPPRRLKYRRRQTEQGATMRLTEIHASTRPYPHWWTDVEDTRILRRRKSSIDTILERNICFIDTPGYAEGSSGQEDTDLVVNYLESLLHQTASVTTLDDGEMVGLVSGSGGVLVDAVLYLLPPSELRKAPARSLLTVNKIRISPRTSSLCSGYLRSPMSYLS